MIHALLLVEGVALVGMAGAPKRTRLCIRSKTPFLKKEYATLRWRTWPSRQERVLEKATLPNRALGRHEREADKLESLCTTSRPARILKGVHEGHREGN